MSGSYAPDDDGDHSAFTHRDDDEEPPYLTEPTPSETALGACSEHFACEGPPSHGVVLLNDEEETALRVSVSPRHTMRGDRHGDTTVRRLLATLDRERLVTQEMWRRESAVSRSLRASRSATEASLRAALDECRQHHADTLAGNERGQHRSATEGRRSALPNDGRCAAQAETIHGWVQCTKPPLHEDRHVWGDDNRVTPAEPFA